MNPVTNGIATPLAAALAQHLIEQATGTVDELTSDTPAPARQQLAPVVLNDEHNHALIGHTVSHDTTPRFVYSLNLLARREQLRARVSPERAREEVWRMVMDITAKHGDAAPLFVDDEVSRPTPGKAQIVLVK